MYSYQDRILAAVIFVSSFIIFRISPVHTIYDSKYEMLFTQQLLQHHSFSVEAKVIPVLQSHKAGQVHRLDQDLPYQLVQVGDRFYYFYPPGNIILGIPYVALANVMGLSAIDQNGSYSVHGDIQMQKGLAALVMAGLSVIIFFTSRLVLCFRWSWLITIAAALGTQIWSTASRAMWSQTWGILVLGFAIWLAVRADVKKTALRPVLLGTCLSWLYFIRPTFGISIAVITLYVLIYQRQSLLTLVLTGCLWLAAFIGFSEYHFGQRLPLYYHSYDTRMASLFWQRLAGTLISPSRGLIIYVPIILFIGYLLGRYLSTSRLRLVVMGVGVVLLHVILVSAYLGWHGGFCYGPRLTTDIVPWLALLGILGVEARLKWRAQNSAHDSALRIGTEWACATVLLLCSITLNALGAISLDTQRWNAVPKNIDEFQNRLWDWKHPQFLGVPRDSPTRHIKDFTPHA